MMAEYKIKKKEVIKSKEFISRIGKRASYAKVDVANILKSMADELRASVSNEETVLIRGLGKLYVTKIPPHRGFDSIRKKEVDLPESTRVTFRLSGYIRHVETEEIGDDDCS